MDTKHLTTFLAVAEHSSITKAADTLRLSQPTVTARIKKLEGALGADLFRRGGNGTSLTGAGRRLWHYAHHIVRLTESAQQAIACPDQARERNLAVRADPALLSHRLLPLVEYMHLRHPTTTLDLKGLDEEPTEVVRKGEADCVYFIGPPAHSELESALLCPEPAVLVTAPGRRLTRAGLGFGTLRGATVLCTHRRDSLQELFEQALRNTNGTVPRVLSLGTLDAVKRGVAEGLGVALLPRIAVDAELADGRLRGMDWQPPFQVFSQVAWRAGLRGDPGFQLLLSASLQVTAEQAAWRTAS
ncbi:LysR family transcriptional regulator [Kitasatospora sp. NPDC036755]|uniref:LysR family transcriptional regulator n=1 Tax=Kitasatospora sp. NPDC036755 TaxID=3154600 RepID=UPI0033C62333